MSALATFKESLQAGKYESITGARRGIGKFKDMTEEEKQLARKLADKHFNVSSDSPAKAPAAAKKAAKKPSKKTSVAKAAAASAEKSAVGPGKGRKKKAVAKKVGRPAGRRAAAVAEDTSVDELDVVDAVTPPARATDASQSLREDVKIANEQMQVLSKTYELAMQDPNAGRLLDLAREKILSVVSNMQVLQTTVTQVSSMAAAAPVVVETAPATPPTTPGNGASSGLAGMGPLPVNLPGATTLPGMPR